MPGSGAAQSSTQPGAGPVQAQLHRILASATFANAPMLRRLLRHLVERTLDAPASLKEYTIGVEVFDRGDGFDPRVDTIVRVQARRLRQKLDEYYRTEGPDDLIRITVPRGRYAAVFTDRATAGESPDRPAIDRGPDDAVPPNTPARFRVPAALTALVGRERECADLAHLLERGDVRLITLTGPGGSGKTRLALHVSHDMTSRFPGGVLFVPLATTVERRVVVATLAQAFGLRDPSRQASIETLKEHLRMVSRRTLLVLDTFEHLLGTAPALVDLLAATPALTVLATSRATLRVSGEHIFFVPPLAVPDADATDEAIDGSPAVRLFVQRAAAVDAGFRDDAKARRAIAAICRRLDGLPLAIELAAARIRLFPVETMLERLAHALDFLTDGPHDAPPRQQALRHTIDWSYQLLSPGEQELLRRLAVFAGGWTLEGAEAVCNGWGDLGLDAAAGVASLLDKSLITAVRGPETEARFDMLDTVREYALEQLLNHEDDARRMARAHAAYCVVLAEERLLLSTPDQQSAWTARCDVEQSNFRAATARLLESGDRQLLLRLLVGLFPFWQRREQFEDARQTLQEALALPATAPPDSTLGRAWAYLAAMASAAGESDQAHEFHSRALEIFQDIGDRRGEAAQLTSLAIKHRFFRDFAAARACLARALEICRDLSEKAREAEALSNLAGVEMEDGDFDAARQIFMQARELFERLEDAEGVSWTDNQLGDLARVCGQADDALMLYRRAIDAFAAAGNRWGMGRTAVDLAYVLMEHDRHADASASLRQALAAFLALGDRRGMARALEGHACLAQRQGDFDRALILAGAATTVRQDGGAALPPPMQLALRRSLEPSWQARDEEASLALWVRGSRMALDEAIAFALG